MTEIVQDQTYSICFNDDKESYNVDKTFVHSLIQLIFKNHITYISYKNTVFLDYNLDISYDLYISYIRSGIETNVLIEFNNPAEAMYYFNKILNALKNNDKKVSFDDNLTTLKIKDLYNLSEDKTHE